MSEPVDYPFRDSGLKLNRAAEHFRSLHLAVGEFVASEPHSLTAEIDVAASRYNVYAKIDNPPPPELSLIAGDFLQNLRAALDHLIWQLVRASGQKPGRSNAFPILVKAPTVKNGGVDRWNRQLRGVDPRFWRFIEKVQPYKRQDRPQLDPLAVLQSLSNEDKHRVVFQRFAAIPHPESAEPRLDIEAVSDVKVDEEYELLANKPIEDGDKIVSAVISVQGSSPQVKLKGELALDVAFGQDLIPAAQLIHIFDRVDAIVALFSAVCFGGSWGPKSLGDRLGPEVFERLG